jgi:hypothetical protein
VIVLPTEAEQARKSDRGGWRGLARWLCPELGREHERRLAEAIEAVVSSEAGGLREHIRAIDGAVFHQLGLRHSGGPRPYRLDETLSSGKGSCVGLASVYAIVACGASLIADWVLNRQHVRVRVSDGAEEVVVDTAGRGILMGSREWHPKLDRVGRGPYGRPLTREEMRAVVLNSEATVDLMAENRLSEAEARLRQAVALFPTFALAHYNLAHLRQQWRR